MADYWTPETVASQRKFGTGLMQAGTDASPVGHWTQALARVLQGGVGGYTVGQANEGERQGKQAVADTWQQGLQRGQPIKAIAASLMGNPWSQEQGQGLAAQALQTEASQEFQRSQQRAAQAFQLSQQDRSFRQQVEMLRKKSEIDREQMLQQARTLGLIPPDTGTAQPPQLPAAMPGPAAVADGGSFDIPDARAPLLSLPGTPQNVPRAASPTPRGPLGDMDEERRNRAAIALILGNREQATKILTEAPDREGQKAYDTELGKGLAKDMGELRDSARKAQAQVAMLEVMEKLAASGTPQGPGTQYELALRRALGAAGIQTNGLSQAEMFNALASQLALSARDPSSGAGMPGAMSDSDRQFLVNMNPNLFMTAEGNRMLIGYMKRVAQRDIEVARFANEYARLNKGRIDDRFFERLAQWSAKNPLFPEAAQPQPQAAGGQQPVPPAPAQTAFTTPDQIPEGVRVIDQATGRRMIKQNGQLVPFVDQSVGLASAPGSRAARAQERRAAADRDAAASLEQVRMQFEQDAAALSPIDVVRKYDGQRGSLSADQLRRLDDLLARATRGNR